MRLRPCLIALLFALLLAACERPSAVPTPIAPVVDLPATDTPFPATPTLAPTGTPPPAAPTATIMAAPTFISTATPFFTGSQPACGQILPILSDPGGPVVTDLTPNAAAQAQLEAIIPDAARPALSRLLAAPETVGLAAYRVGQANQGAYLNDEVPMPLASVIKVVHLVAYAEAAAAGTLDPTAAVTLDALNDYYLPNLDLGAHPNAVAELETQDRVFGDPDTVLLEAVPEMMIAFSSNAATDYLHLLLGQRTIEETAVSLGLTSQTAPCPFLGQFLAMANHTRRLENDQLAIEQYIANPDLYGRDAMLLTEAYSSDAAFREAAVSFRRQTRRPNGRAQRFFTEALNPQGSARDYAGLMARIAANGLSSGESSFLARRYLEWPMRFEANQELFSNLGYKNGSLPGVLTTVYYAYPLGEETPVVVALFFRDLNGRTYHNWRNDLPHDELARWLLYDPEAIPALRAILSP